MKKLLLLGLFITTVTAFASKETKLARKTAGGFGSYLKSQGSVASDDVDAGAVSSGVDFDSSEAVPQVCTRKEQTSLPLWVVEELIEYDEIPVGKNSQTSSSPGIIQLNGGRMIGNCRSMLKPGWDINEGGKDHYFNLSVKKPTEGCKTNDKGKYVCPYEVVLAEDGVAQDDKPTMFFEPNYYGFAKCMQDTGVWTKEGTFDGSKVAETVFKYTKKPVNSSGNIMYYCKGPECNSTREGGKVVSNSLKKGGTCEHAQPINSKRPRILSRAENNRNIMEAEFRKVCNTLDYATISQRLPSFTQYKDLYDILEHVRDQLILNKVKKLAKKLKDKKKGKLGKLDAEEYRDAILALNKYIIIPTKKKIAKLYAEMGKMTDKNNIKRHQAKIDELVENLREYSGKKYFNSKAYKRMKSFAEKAPLHKEEWITAAATAYRIINTAFNYDRFHSKLDKRLKKKIKDGKIDYDVDLSPSEANKEITKQMKKEVELLEKFHELANDEDGEKSYANEYLAEAEDVQVRHQIRLEDLQDELYEAKEARYECYNSSIGFYGFLSQSCEEDNYYLQQEIMNDIDYYSHPDYQQYVLGPTIQETMNKANFWAGVERDRNLAYDVTPPTRVSRFARDRDSYRRPNFSGNFADQYLRNQQLARQSYARQWNTGLQQSPAQNWALQSRLPANNGRYQPNINRPFVNQNWMFAAPQMQQRQQVPFYLQRPR